LIGLQFRSQRRSCVCATVMRVASAAPPEISYSFIFLLGAGNAGVVGAARCVLLLIAGVTGVFGARRLVPALPPAPTPVFLALAPAPEAPVGWMTLRGRPTRSASTLYARAASSGVV
jgi:hypothetical protein